MIGTIAFITLAHCSSPPGGLQELNDQIQVWKS